MLRRGMHDELDEFRRYSYMESRIPVLDALEVFVLSGKENDTELNAIVNRTGFSRWFPAADGHRVLILDEGGDYDSRRFTLIKGAWDYEHCKRCQKRITPMTLCWVTANGPYIVLCEECHRVVVGSDEASP
jgi:hypothetical protein